MGAAKYISSGIYLPKTIVSNNELIKRHQLDTTSEWIKTRSGISQRHIAQDDEDLLYMAKEACHQALQHAGKKPEEVDLVLVATSTSGQSMPSTACRLQQELGIKSGPAFDLNAACSGFMYALKLTQMWIQTNQAKLVLVVGADCMSQIMDWQDRSTCILFGDGAGALLFTQDNEPGLHSVDINSDGSYAGLLHTTGKGVNQAQADYLMMEGREVFKVAVRTLQKLVLHTLQVNNLEFGDIDWLVPHQANSRIIESIARTLNMPMSKVIMTIEWSANTSAASIPIALHDGIKSGKITQGQKVILEAFGAGFTWGSALLEV
jgi:3-oxoacyl-[acyl-carrier-protein] synthase III